MIIPDERRQNGPDFRARGVLKLNLGKKGRMEPSREYQINYVVLPRWMQEFIERAGQIFRYPVQANGQAERVAELERLMEQLTLQLDKARKGMGYSGFLP